MCRSHVWYYDKLHACSFVNYQNGHSYRVKRMNENMKPSAQEHEDKSFVHIVHVSFIVRYKINDK